MKQIKPRIKKTTLKTPLAKKKPKKEIVDVETEKLFKEIQEFVDGYDTKCHSLSQYINTEYQRLSWRPFNYKYEHILGKMKLSLLWDFSDVSKELTIKKSSSERVHGHLKYTYETIKKRIDKCKVDRSSLPSIIRYFHEEAEALVDEIEMKINQDILWKLQEFEWRLKKIMDEQKEIAPSKSVDIDHINGTFPLKKGLRVYKEEAPGFIVWADKQQED